jgi:hypothetical protein
MRGSQIIVEATQQSHGCPMSVHYVISISSGAHHPHSFPSINPRVINNESVKGHSNGSRVHFLVLTNILHFTLQHQQCPIVPPSFRIYFLPLQVSNSLRTFVDEHSKNNEEVSNVRTLRVFISGAFHPHSFPSIKPRIINPSNAI